MLELHAAGFDALSDAAAPEYIFYPMTLTSAAQELQYQKYASPTGPSKCCTYDEELERSVEEDMSSATGHSQIAEWGKEDEDGLDSDAISIVGSVSSKVNRSRRTEVAELPVGTAKLKEAWLKRRAIWRCAKLWKQRGWSVR